MDNSSLNVLILAAGLGTRLRPLTNDVPKPLVPVVDASILDLQARKARAIGNVRLHANAHYLAEQVVEAGNVLGFEKVWVEQPEILGTAGPLRRIYAEGYRGGLLVMNGDAYCNFDLRAFVSNAQSLAARPNGPQVALLAVDFPKVNTFRVGADGRLAGIAGRFGETSGTPATFSGVSWYSDAALSRIREGESDIAVEARLKELGRDVNEAVIEPGVKIPAGVTIKHSVIYAGAEIAEGETVENEIRGKDFKWKV